MKHLKDVPEIRHLIEEADFVTHRSVAGHGGLRTFLSGMCTQSPRWMSVRAPKLHSGEKVSFETLRRSVEKKAGDEIALPGDRLLCFVTVAASDVFWIGEQSHRNLRVFFAVAVEDREDGPELFHVANVVRFKNVLGLLQFFLLRPFHAWISRKLMIAGSRAVCS